MNVRMRSESSLRYGVPLLASAFAILCTLSQYVHSCFGQSDTDPWPSLRLCFVDDFKANSKNNYEVLGEATWTSGQVTLMDNSSISRSIVEGPWVSIELGVEWQQLTREKATNVVDVCLGMSGATDCYVRLHRRIGTSGNEEVELSLFDTQSTSNKPIGVRVKSQVVAGKLPNTLLLQYRYGHVCVSHDERRFLMAQIDNGSSSVSSVRVVAKTNAVGLKIVRVESAANPCRKLSEDEEREADSLTESRESVDSMTKIGEFRKALQLAENNLKKCESLFGKTCFDYPICLGRAALLNKKVGNYSRAIELGIEDLDISEKLFGIEHPNVGSVANNLSGMYMDVSDFDKAELFANRALAIFGQTLNKDGADYLVSSANLGTVFSSDWRQ